MAGVEDAAIGELRDRAAIRDLLMRYGHAVDRRDFERVAACFTPDASYDGSLGDGDIATALAALRERMARFESTMHFMSTQVIELAGDTANGVKGHVGLTADAPIKAVQEFRDKFQKRFKYLPDHNGIKGYTAVYAVKHATEKMGKFDRKQLAKTMHGLTITPQQEPGILIETTWDAKGDIDRISFLVEVVDGKQKVVEIVPKLGK